jgi:hypothetical protein
MFAILLFCLLPSASFTADLQDLVSASNHFEVEMIEHEHVLHKSGMHQCLFSLVYTGYRYRTKVP